MGSLTKKSWYTSGMDTASPKERPHAVLIVEDNDEVRKMLERRLAAEGFSVATAADGAIGLTKARANKPEVILLDILMPGMSGLEVLTTLRSEGAWGESVPVILLTNVDPTDEAVNENIAQTSPAYYISKTNLDLNDLVAKIHGLLPTT